jgi:hypothetical protein
MKITITAIVTFEGDTDDADPDLNPVDQANEIALLMLPAACTLEEVLEWEPV